MPASLAKHFRYDPSKKIYERQPGEPETAWRAYRIYRDMGSPTTERSLSGATRKYMKIFSKNAKFESMQANLYRWKGQFEWERRVAAWDDETDRQLRRQHRKKVEKMRERQVSTGQELQKLGGIELIKYLEDAEAMDIKTINVTDLLSVLREGLRMESAGLGEPVEVKESRIKAEVEATTSVKRELDLSKLSDEELKMLRQAKQKLIDGDTSSEE